MYLRHRRRCPDPARDHRRANAERGPREMDTTGRRTGGHPTCAPARLGPRLSLAATGERRIQFRDRRRRAESGLDPYPAQPRILSITNGAWEQAPAWCRGFHYCAERERGLDDVEDLASPGILHFRLGAQSAVWVVGTRDLPALDDLDAVVAAERARRSHFPSALARAADAYLVSRGAGRTIIADYPWFSDWGRDTFIAVRGLCLATGRLADARDILMEWAGTVSEGMLPNRFPDGATPPEYNSIDASLWFVVATGELLEQAAVESGVLSPLDRCRLEGACVAVLEGLARGTRYGHPVRHGRLARVRCARHSAHVDGCEGWRTRHHTEGGQAR
jgi:hypothetical protein